MLQRLVTNTNLNSPWGVNPGPVQFRFLQRRHSGRQLRRWHDQRIRPGDRFLPGKISGTNGSPLVDGGLWALNFRAPGSGVDPNTLFLNAGINGEADGLFAAIAITPEPSTIMMLALAAVLLAWRNVRSRA